MAKAPQTLDGWYALHDLRRVDWSVWRSLSAAQRHSATEEAVRLLGHQMGIAEESGSSALYTVVGHKGDLMLVHLRPTLDELHELEWDLDRTALGTALTRQTSYVSVIELSTYGARGPQNGDPYENPYVRKRLYRPLPENRYICFYPMDKKRGESENWYTLPFATRREMMESHGLIGRSYAGKVTQIITGSIGLDDFEWGVTLFADDPLQFKRLIHEMRFDEVSSRYAVFGPFYVGLRLELQNFARRMMLEADGV